MLKVSDRDLTNLILEELDNLLNFNEEATLEEGRPKASKTKSGRKVPGKYLTKDKSAMKGEIERVSKLKSNDPDAYGKWVADYKARNTQSGKPHKTKKSAATIAYEKKFGKKNENMKKIKESYDYETQRDLVQLKRGALDIEPKAQKIANHIMEKGITDISEVIEYLKQKNINDSDLITRIIDLISSDKNIKENLNKDDERYKECWDEIDMRLPWDKNTLRHYEFDEIADTCGLDFEQVIEIFQSYLIDREKKKREELKKEIEYIFDEVDFYNHNYTFEDFLEYWKENNFEIDYGWADEKDLKKVFDELTVNPNQIKLDLNEDVDKALSNKAKASGVSKSILRAVYSKGAAAWKSGHRPGVSQQQWAMGRVNSFLTGKGGARKADAKLWARAKKSKKRKNESVEEELLRKKIREILFESYKDQNLDELYPLIVGEENLDEINWKEIKKKGAKLAAGAAIGLGMALGSPSAASAQTTFKDSAKEKITMVKDKIGNVFNKKKTTDIEPDFSDMVKKSNADQDIQDLKKQVGQIEKIGDNTYSITGYAESPDISFVESLAMQNAQQSLAQQVKGISDDSGRTITNAKITNTKIKSERKFQSSEGKYMHFVTIIATVN